MIKSHLLEEEYNTYYLKFLSKKNLPPPSPQLICSFIFIGMDVCVFLSYFVLQLNTIIHFLAQFFQLNQWEALLVCLLLIDLIIVGTNFLQPNLINVQLLLLPTAHQREWKRKVIRLWGVWTCLTIVLWG